MDNRVNLYKLTNGDSFIAQDRGETTTGDLILEDAYNMGYIQTDYGPVLQLTKYLPHTERGIFTISRKDVLTIAEVSQELLTYYSNFNDYFYLKIDKVHRNDMKELSAHFADLIDREVTTRMLVSAQAEHPHVVIPTVSMSSTIH